MNEYQRAWLEQIWKRDMFYLYTLIIVVVAYLWYRWILKPYIKLVIAAFFTVVLGGIGFGLWVLLTNA